MVTAYCSIRIVRACVLFARVWYGYFFCTDKEGVRNRRSPTCGVQVDLELSVKTDRTEPKT